MYVVALKLYGKDWDKIQAHVGTRTVKQIRSHSQKYQEKLGDEETAIIKSKAKHEGKRTRIRKKKGENNIIEDSESDSLDPEDESPKDETQGAANT